MVRRAWFEVDVGMPQQTKLGAAQGEAIGAEKDHAVALGLAHPQEAYQLLPSEETSDELGASMIGSG